MILDTLHSAGLYCTGCGACQSVCSCGAIQMQPDDEGFFQPVIDHEKCSSCSLCEHTCPQLQPKKDHKENPFCYAVRADMKTIQVSSSGGAFTILADYVFGKGGYVCGAAFDVDFHGVSLVMISNPDELGRLRGSKYVYSKPGHIYEQVKEKLEKGSYVLFSGTPCQVAALRNVLGREYDRLLLVDILCGGVPSEKIFSKYMDEISLGKKVVSVRFRPKEYGWSYSGIETVFSDGSKHMIHSVQDPYLRGFLNWLYVGNACASCQFAPPARQGDISIGDFWNLDRYEEGLKFSDGVNCLLLNTEKAEKIFHVISKNFALKRKIPLSFLKRFNRVQEKRAHHLARQRFFSLMKRGFSLEKAVDDSLMWKFDVALSGCWTVPNYGGELTYYALYCVLNDLGYSTIMVERRANIPDYDIPSPELFLKSPYPFYDVSRIHKNFQDQSELNARVRNFVLGSDQVWNFNLMREDEVFSWTFDYVEDYRKKISYSASFGGESLKGNKQQNEQLQSLLSKFDFLSVREPSGIKILNEEVARRAVWALDPVFICDRRHLEKIQKNANVVCDGKYVFTYLIWPNIEICAGIDEFTCRLGYGLINTIGADKDIIKAEGDFLRTWPYPYEENCKLENWLKYLANSSFVLTDSFHAVCLSILYKIPFVFISGEMSKTDGLGRITSILDLLGIKDRIARTVKDALSEEKYKNVIDYDSVHKILEKEKLRCLKWLKMALASDKVLD